MLPKFNQVVAGRHLFHQEIGAELLFQPGRDGGQRRHPVRLVGLGLVRALKPGVEEAVLGVESAAEQQGGERGEHWFCHINENYYRLEDNTTSGAPRARGPVARGGQSRYD